MVRPRGFWAALGGTSWLAGAWRLESYSWLDQRLRAGQFMLPDGTTVQPRRTPGGLTAVGRVGADGFASAQPESVSVATASAAMPSAIFSIVFLSPARLCAVATGILLSAGALLGWLAVGGEAWTRS
jgi:hypothetical protein